MKLKKILIGAAVGIINGFFGAAGGVAAVFFLERLGFEQNKSHAAAVGIILPVSLVSIIFYFLGGKADLTLAVKTIPFGVLGSLLGTKFLKNINPKILKGLFGVLLIYSGISLIRG